MNLQNLLKPEEEAQMLRDCLRSLHATVLDKTQPATAKQQATRTLLEVLQVIGAKAKERDGQPVSQPQEWSGEAGDISAQETALKRTKRLLDEMRARLEGADLGAGDQAAAPTVARSGCMDGTDSRTFNGREPASIIDL